MFVDIIHKVVYQMYYINVVLMVDITKLRNRLLKLAIIHAELFLYTYNYIRLDESTFYIGLNFVVFLNANIRKLNMKYC